MATNSFFKDIEINEMNATNLLHAMEITDKTTSVKEFDVCKKCTELKGDSIKVFFGKKG